MPTGYTSKIHDGEAVSFPQFAMTCARAFGALIEMRDEDLTAPIPQEFTPSPYYTEARVRAAERLAEVKAWTPEQARAEAAEQVAAIEKSNARARDLREKYAAMAAEAEAWLPPTPDHEELKRFMLQQLHESARFDCHEMEAPAPPDGAAYQAQQITSAREAVARARQHQAEEIERARDRTEWVRALRASLGEAATAEGGEG
jgi:hypothetical protein